MNSGRFFGFLVILALLGGGVYGWMRAEGRRRGADEAEARAVAAENARAGAVRDRDVRAKESEALVEGLRKRVAELEAAGQDREKELLAVRADLERTRRAAEEQARRVRELEALKVPPPGPGEEGRKREDEGEEVIGSPHPPVVKVIPDPEPKPPSKKPPAPDLGPTAVSDPGQLKKLVDGLNTLLAGVGGEESWKVASAGAAEDDRLVTVVLDARGTGGTVSKSFKAAEARFVLQTASGTLSIKLKEGSVTYPGNRTVPFPEGAYTVLLVVDSAPFRAAGHPLVSIQ